MVPGPRGADSYHRNRIFPEIRIRSGVARSSGPDCGGIFLRSRLVISRWHLPPARIARFGCRYRRVWPWNALPFQLRGFSSSPFIGGRARANPDSNRDVDWRLYFEPLDGAIAFRSYISWRLSCAAAVWLRAILPWVFLGYLAILALGGQFLSFAYGWRVLY